jgi:hypothetical protein
LPSTSLFGTPGTDELLITGAKGNDDITINDNATGAARNISVSVPGRTVVSSGVVTVIAVDPGAGNDFVTYNLNGQLQPDVQEAVIVGSTGSIRREGGSVKFTANIMGRIPEGTTVDVLGVANPTKAITMTVGDASEIDGELQAGIVSAGSSQSLRAPETFNFSSASAIGPNGKIATGLSGGIKKNVASISYSGVNNGEIDIEAVGQGPNDQLSADVHMVPGSTGSVGDSTRPAVVGTTGRKGRLSFAIHQGTDSTTTSNIFAQITDMSKGVVSRHTHNVIAFTKGRDQIVP